MRKLDVAFYVSIAQLVELLMSSRGHLLLTMIVIYQNVWLDMSVTKMVPANFHMSTFMVKSKHFRIQWASGYVMIYG